MKTQLKSLESNIKTNNPRLFGLLKPGLNYEQISEMTSELGFQLSRELCELYVWRNGTRTEGCTLGEMSFIPKTVYHFMGLEEALGVHKVLNSSYSSMLESPYDPLPPDSVSDYYFAFLWDGANGLYLVPCFDSMVDESPVVNWFPEYGVIREYDNIRSLIAELNWS